MNHYLLPGTLEDDAGDSNRGLSSVQMLVRSMITRRADLCNVEAKVFGGCNSLYRANDLFKVGARNVATAFSVLRDYNIRVSAQHVGGQYGRKIVFNTSTGKVTMRLLIKTQNINEKIDKGFGY
jgi:chemotaxis protein CheD